MAGGGRTYYATGAGRFSKGSEIRADQSGVAEATRKGELRIKTSFGTTTKAPTGTMSKEELTKVLRSGDTVKFGDGTSVKVTAANKVATINRLVSEGQRQITPAPARTGSILGGQFRGQPTAAAKPATPAQPAKPAPRGQPKPAPKPSAPKPAGKPVPRPAGKPSPKPAAPKPAAPKPSAPKPAPPATPTKKGGNNGGKNPPPAKAPAKGTKGGKDGGRTKGSKKGAGFISSAGVVNVGNRRKGGGGKKDRAKGKAKPRRKGGRSGRGRKK